MRRATRFLALINQFVYDIGTALEGSGGLIYRYVGDEAIITWRSTGRATSPTQWMSSSACVPGSRPVARSTGAISACYRTFGPPCMRGRW